MANFYEKNFIQVIIDELSVYESTDTCKQIVDQNSFLEVCKFLKEMEKKVADTINSNIFLTDKSPSQKYDLPILILVKNKKFQSYFEIIYSKEVVEIFTPARVLSHNLNLKEEPIWFKNSLVQELDLLGNKDWLIATYNRYQDLKLEDIVLMKLLKTNKESYLERIKNKNPIIILFEVLSLNDNVSLNTLADFFYFFFSNHKSQVKLIKNIVSTSQKWKIRNFPHAICEIYYLKNYEQLLPEFYKELVSHHPKELISLYDDLSSELQEDIKLIITYNKDYFSDFRENSITYLREKKEDLLNKLYDELFNLNNTISENINYIISLFNNVIIDSFQLKVIFNTICFHIFIDIKKSNKALSIEDRDIVINFLNDSKEFNQSILMDSDMVSLIDTIKRLVTSLITFSTIQIKVDFKNFDLEQWINYYKERFIHYSMNSEIIFSEHDLFKYQASKELEDVREDVFNSFIIDYSEVQSQFEKFILTNYPLILRTDQEVTIKDVLKKINKLYSEKNADRVYLIVVDGMSLSSWIEIKKILSKYKLTISEQLILSAIPSITEISRRSLFGGKTFLEIKNDKTIYNPHNEDELLRRYFSKKSSIPIKYATEKDFKESIKKQYRLITYVIKEFDQYSHLKAKIPSNLRTLMLNEASKSLENFIKFIMSSNFGNNDYIVITTDHGMLRVFKPISISRDFRDHFQTPFSSGRALMLCELERNIQSYSRTNTLINEMKSKFHVIENSNLHEYGLPVIFKKMRAIQLLLAPGNKRISWQKSPYTHGGISMEELIIPYIELKLDKQITEPDITIAFTKKLELGELLKITISVNNNTSRIVYLESVSLKGKERILDSYINDKETKSLTFSILADEKGVFKEKITLSFSIADIKREKTFEIEFSVKEKKTKVERATDSIIEELIKNEK